MDAAPVPSEARIFLEALSAGKPEEHVPLALDTSGETIVLVPKGRRRDSVCRISATIGISMSAWASPAKIMVPTRRCPSNEVAGIFGLWADLDLKSDAHSKTALPATVEDALQILPEQLPPTFVVQTGNGAHAWWLFKEPLIFETEQERAHAASLAERWQSLLRLNAASHGWAFDRLSDLARVLRVPGTRNCKNPANPKPVAIHLQTDRRYNPSDLAEYLDELGIPDAEAQEQAAQAWKEKFADKPLTIDPSATVPEDFLGRCMDTDPRFQKTWLRQRDDLKDQSQSGYDLALANFGQRGRPVRAATRGPDHPPPKNSR